jgi:hypothetical protein
MRFLAHFLLLCLLPMVGWAQSSLPPCASGATAYWHNCYTWPPLAKYAGKLNDDEFDGRGTLKWADGRKYWGEFKDNQPNGQGIQVWPDGRKYVGEFKDGKRSGQGTFTWLSGEMYVGEFKDDKFNGWGTFLFSTGKKYVGKFKDDAFDHQGTLTWPYGPKYVGELKGYEPNGLGIEYDAHGTVNRSGLWVSGFLNQSFALDKSQFPFNGITQTATPSVDSGRAERDRLAQEADAARRKQQELEQRLAAEAAERSRLAAEAEAARRRQQELEARLATLQSQSVSRPPSQAGLSRNQRRVALVIGNSQYKVSPLANPVNDATDVDQTLRQLGFQTTLVRNATLDQMREATRRFADQLQSADVALIYFAGHGIESNRKNYMIPVNADLKFEYELADQAYDAGNWLDMFESIKSSNAERVNIVILDACRNNSLIGARSLGRGLGRMDAPTGTFLAYSTAPGKVAADGVRGQRNSPFTRHLLSVMQQPGLPIEEAFKEVRRNVSRETNGAQVPWESTSLTGFFTFRQVR